MEPTQKNEFKKTVEPGSWFPDCYRVIGKKLNGGRLVGW